MKQHTKKHTDLVRRSATFLGKVFAEGVVRKTASATQLNPDNGELPNVAEWRRAAQTLYSSTMKCEIDALREIERLSRNQGRALEEIHSLAKGTLDAMGILSTTDEQRLSKGSR